MPAMTDLPLPPRLWALKSGILLLSCLLLAAAGCAAPAPGGNDPTATSPIEQAAAPIPAQTAERRAPPMSDPLPPLRAPQRDAQRAPRPGDGTVPVVVDTSCTRDADCTIKNVGNCCGQYPACVNVNSPTDPEGVQAQCAREGLMSVCGFPSISACQCVAGECRGTDTAVVQ